MSKRTSLLLTGITLAIDFLMVAAALGLAYVIRFLSIFEDWMPVASEVNWSAYPVCALLLAAFWVFFQLRKGEYGHLSFGDPTRLDRYLVILFCGIKAEIGLLAVGALYREWLISRYVLVLSFVFACIFLSVSRELIRRWLERNPVYRAILICPAAKMDEVQEKLKTRIVGIREVSCLSWEQYADRIDQVLIEKVQEHRADMVFLLPYSGMLEDGSGKTEFFSMLNVCESMNIAAYMIPDVFDVAVRREEMYSFTDVALIRLRDACIHPVYILVKRAFDVLVSAAILLLGLPVWGLVALIIKLQDGGPVFFLQCRVGIHGTPFDMIKFRTMTVDADKFIVNKIASGEMDESLVFNIRKDPRVTRFGNFLRRWSLDEIPQLINVLKNEMSLVGPRPERKELVDRYSPLQRRRLKALPGITGLQQVVSRGDPSLPRRIQLDLIYISKQSLFMDAYILLRTIWVVIRGLGVK